MKFPISYDLLDMISSVNGNVNIKKIMLEQLRVEAITYGFFTAMDLISRRDDGVQWLHNLSICLGWFAGAVAFKGFLDYKAKDAIAAKACLELTKLVVQLGNNLDVNTSLDLLKESELIKTEYKPIIQNSKPIIQQNKYILVPAYDGLENIREASILQEHEIGSKQYLLSIGSPKRSTVLKPAFNI